MLEKNVTTLIWISLGSMLKISWIYITAILELSDNMKDKLTFSVSNLLILYLIYC